MDQKATVQRFSMFENLKHLFIACKLPRLPIYLLGLSKATIIKYAYV